jgi:diadenosine tetraphosphate (Ap4A) HIT family hydrolase
LSEAEGTCVFCRIAAHTAPAKIRYEDAELVAFDAEPAATPLHVRVAAQAGATSFRLATNSGAPLQEVFHLHWHVMSGGEMGHPAGVGYSREAGDGADRLPNL